MRLFTAIRLPADVAQYVRRVQAALQPYVDSKRWQPLKNLHLTLHFLGEVQQAFQPHLIHDLTAVLRGAHPFQLQLARVGVFGGPTHPRVLWIGTEGDVDALCALQRKMAAALEPFGYQETGKPYRPHITLARDPRGPLDIPQLNQCISSLPATGWKVEEIILYQSQLHPEGAIHSIVRTYPLQP